MILEVFGDEAGAVTTAALFKRLAGECACARALRACIWNLPPYATEFKKCVKR
jgi:hypothetical protein